MPNTNNNRRTFLKRTGALGMGLLGIGNIGQVSAATLPRNIHPEDKYRISNKEFNERGKLQKTVSESPVLNRSKIGNEIVIYYDEKNVQKYLLNGSNIKNNTSLTAQVKNSKKAKEIEARSRKVDQIVENQINESIQSHEPTDIPTINLDSTQLGSNQVRASRTLSNCTTGSTGRGGGWGNKLSEINLAADNQEAETFISPGAVGSGWCWAWLGTNFTVSSSGYANLVADVNHSGTIWAASAASASFVMKFKVHNKTDNYTKTNKFVNQKVQNDVVGEKDVIGSKRPTISMSLESGKQYQITADLKASVSVGGVGGGTADMGENLDSNHLSYEHCSVNHFEIH